MLMFRGNAEIGEDQGDDEDVVHRERKLDEIAGEEFERFLGAARWPKPEAKTMASANQSGPDQRFLETDDVGLAVENPQVERQENNDASDETNPVPGGDCNQRKHDCGLPSGSVWLGRQLCRAADVRPLAFVPPEHDRAGDVDARIGAGDDADQEREREVVDGAAAENKERQRGEEHRAGGDDRPAQGLVQRLVHRFPGTCRARPSFKSSRMRSKMTMVSLMEKPMMVSTAATMVALNSRPARKVTADGHQHVVDHRHDGAHGEREFIAERDVNQDAEHREQRGYDSSRLNFLADGRPFLAHAERLSAEVGGSGMHS